MKPIFAISALALLFLVPFSVFAHSAGASYEVTSQGYTVDIGYSVPAPQVDESVAFDFGLRKSGASEDSNAPFDDVWVKIESNDTKSVVFASGIHNAEFGGPRISYVFPHAGEYTISARYENKDGSLAEASFPMTVVPAEGGQNAPNPLVQNVLFAVLGFLAGAGGVYFWGRSALRKMPSTGA